MASDPAVPLGHRLSLSADWSLWREAALRSAGFPYGYLARVVAADVAAAASRLDAALGAYRLRCSQLAQQCGVISRGLEGREERRLKKAINRLRHGQLAPALAERPQLQPLLDAARAAFDQYTRALEEFTSIYDRGAQRSRSVLLAAAADPLFREALVWQNRALLDTALAPLLRHAADATGAAARQHARLVAEYLQRYASKNETIGFFGPLAWIQLDPATANLRMQVGPRLLAERMLHFEHWAIRALAEGCARDPALRAWLCPRLAPTCRVEALELYRGDDQTIALSESQARVLSLLSGDVQARELPALLGADDSSYPEIAFFLESLAAARLVVWAPSIPIVPHPEAWLRKLLERVGDPHVRGRLIAPLDSLEQARLSVARCAGDSRALDAAMADLEHRFTSITGKASRRAAGSVSAGRGLLYEDCIRDVALTLGKSVIDRLAAPLSLVLTSARWFTWQLAGQYMDWVRGAWELCRSRAGDTAVALTTLWRALQDNEETLRLLVDDVVEQLEERWAPLLLGAEPENCRRVSLRAEALRDAVDAAFDAPGPGWPGARFHSPDVLIAAQSVDAIRAGQFTLVLGELHASGNTLLQATFLALHPQATQFLAQAQRDQPEAELSAVVNHAMLGERGVYDPALVHGVHVEFDDVPSWRAREQVIPIAQLVVDEDAQGLRIRTRDHSRSFPAISFFGPQLRGFCARRFRLLGPRPHTPRIAIDDLVVSRESWRFPARELAFARGANPAERFRGAWELRSTHALPRWVFVRTSSEHKPVHVDFDSPPLVELMAKLVRAATAAEEGWVSLVEMLPSPEQLWLPDANGERYTSELRLVALDKRLWPGDADRFQQPSS